MKAKEEEEVTLEVLQEVVMVLLEPVLWAGQEVDKNPIWVPVADVTPGLAFKGLMGRKDCCKGRIEAATISDICDCTQETIHYLFSIKRMKAFIICLLSVFNLFKRFMKTVSSIRGSV